MAQTEQNLRDALSGLSAGPPEVTDLVGRVERRLRRRRLQEVAIALVLVVLVVLPLQRWLPDRVNGDDTLPTGPVQAQMDARMQYAAFVAWWDGRVAGGVDADADAGVNGVQVSTTLPPVTCAIAQVSDGEPSGTQTAWVLGEITVLVEGDRQLLFDVPLVTTSLVLWSQGVTDCAVRPPGETLVFQPPSTRVAAPIAFSQSFSDPSRPALDVARVYDSIPQDQITDYGREVFAAYEAELETLDFGTPSAQTERALTSLAQWVSVGVTTQTLQQQSPQVGPVVLNQGLDPSSLQLPEGFSVRWTEDGRFCVDGAVAGSAVSHVDTDSYQGNTDSAQLLPNIGDGPCP